MRFVLGLFGVLKNILTIKPYLRGLFMVFYNQLHENDFSFGAEKHFFLLIF